MIKRVSKGKLPSKKEGKSSFKYQKRSMEAVKARAEQTGGRFDSPFKQNFDVFRPKVGDNLIRYLPPTWEDAEHYGYDIWVHRFIGPDNSTYLCPRKMLGKPCSVCDASKEASDADEKDEAKALAATKMVLTWILDRDAEDPDQPILYPMSWPQDRDVTSLCINKRTGKVLLIDNPDDGFDVTVKRHGLGLKTRYQFQIDRDPSPLHDDPDTQDKILEYIQDNPLESTLNYYDNDYLEKILTGSTQEKDEIEEEDEKPRRRRRSKDEDEDEEEVKPRRRRRSEPEEDEDEDEEEEKPRRRKRADPEDEEEEEDEKPRRRRRKPEPEDEDEDEEEEKPRRRRRRSRDEDEDEEEEEVKPRRRRRAEPEEEDEDEEEEEKPRRRRRPEPEEEDEDEEEDEEEEDERPRRRRRR